MQDERGKDIKPSEIETGVSKVNLSRRQALIFGGLAAAISSIATLTPPGVLAAEALDQKVIDVVFVLYPTFTLQDFAGANEVLARLPNINVRVATPDGGSVTSDTNITLANTLKLSDVKSCDVLCITGGTSQKRAMMEDVQDDLRRLVAQAKYVTSVCNGSLILGNAGVLKGKRSACLWFQRNLLKQYGAIPDASRVVIDGNFISGGGVTAGIDFALTLGAILRGPIDTQVIQLTIEYAPQPPFNSGDIKTAPPEVVEAWKKKFARWVPIAEL